MVEANDLSMNYGPVAALTKASFKAYKGEVMGLLGPNGAGKTTTMKILTTQIVPTSGGGKVAGFDILKDPLEVRSRVGYLPETPPLYGEMEVAEYLDFVGRARGLSGSELKNRIDFVVNACGLREVFKTTVGTLSHGYSQRAGLAQALIHDPEILILDEPTSGLDPMQIIIRPSFFPHISCRKWKRSPTGWLSSPTVLSWRTAPWRNCGPRYPRR
jgi:ABC-2 type transport system ATP-binding protein